MRVNSINPRVAKLVLWITQGYKLKIVQVHAPMTSYLEEDINSFYNDVGETLGRPKHYMIMMGDFNAQIGKRTNPMEMGKFGIELRNERGDTLVEWTTSRKYKILNTMFQKKAERRTWKSPNSVAKAEIDYILTNGPDITVIN